MKKILKITLGVLIIIQILPLICLGIQFFNSDKFSYIIAYEAGLLLDLIFGVIASFVLILIFTIEWCFKK